MNLIALIRQNYGKGKGNTHILKTAQGCDCNSGRCNICDAGLGFCIICKAAEVELGEYTCEEYQMRQQSPRCQTCGGFVEECHNCV